MVSVALVGLVDQRGWLLMQERDEHAPVDPDRWSLVGGGVEPGESGAAAARRELEEETTLVRDDLRPLGTLDVACAVHGQDRVELFTARTSATDADIDCREGRQIVFVAPDEIAGLDLTDATRALFPLVLAAHAEERTPDRTAVTHVSRPRDDDRRTE
jgi:8-oxo-dGTP pyrophosphatase MutT (NUDIX family)